MKIDFGRFGRRVIKAAFSGGDLSSDGGLLLLRQVDEHLGLSRTAAAALPDPRDPERITHPLRDLLAQRLYGLCCCNDDLSDYQALRGDCPDADAGAGLGTHVPPARELRHAPAGLGAARGVRCTLHPATRSPRQSWCSTLTPRTCRCTGEGAWRLSRPLRPPLLPAAVRVLQLGDCWRAGCRPAKSTGAPQPAAAIKLIVSRLRRAWPATRFIVRADSGFCRRRLLQWCERSSVGYVIGLARSARLQAAVEVAEACLADTYAATASSSA